MQLLLQLYFGWQCGPVLGHSDAVFVHLQQLHLFAAGLDAQDGAACVLPGPAGARVCPSF